MFPLVRALTSDYNQIALSTCSRGWYGSEASPNAVLYIVQHHIYILNTPALSTHGLARWCPHGGLDPSPPVFEFPLLKPSKSPNIPGGFGTGHSLLALLSRSCCSELSPSTADFTVTPSLSSPSAVFRRLRRLRCSCSPSIAISPSAKAVRGTGQGKACGKATTKNDASSVVANRELVNRDRGWRCGGMFEVVAGRNLFRGVRDVSVSRLATQREQPLT